MKQSNILMQKDIALFLLDKFESMEFSPKKIANII